MILDINLPDGDGFTLLRQLHAKADVPALFLSARDADADRLLGLGLGADDYLTKPFLMQELLLRVQRILQRAYRAELCRAALPALELGDCQVDLADATAVSYTHLLEGSCRRRRLRNGCFSRTNKYIFSNFFPLFAQFLLYNTRFFYII